VSGTLFDFQRLLKARETLPAPQERKKLRTEAGVSAKTMSAFLDMSVSAFYALEKSPNPGNKYLVAYVAMLNELRPKIVPQEVAAQDAEEGDELMREWRENQCGSCGGLHATAIRAPGSCPRIRSATYDPKGQVQSVTFWADGKWPKDGIWWPPTEVAEKE
jgi:hypothetical protein